MKPTMNSDAVTDSDALSYIGTVRVCAGARIPQYTKLRHCPSLRHSMPPADGRVMDIVLTLEELAGRVRRLVPLHRDPEAFHEEKSEIEADLRRLARVLPGGQAYGTGGPGISSDGPVLVAKVPGLRKA